MQGQFPRQRAEAEEIFQVFSKSMCDDHNSFTRTILKIFLQNNKIIDMMDIEKTEGGELCTHASLVTAADSLFVRRINQKKTIL
jgi:Ni2+-binding GTPase involved in maturation of urease and hydrogenase